MLSARHGPSLVGGGGAGCDGCDVPPPDPPVVVLVPAPLATVVVVDAPGAWRSVVTVVAPGVDVDVVVVAPFEEGDVVLVARPEPAVVVLVDVAVELVALSTLDVVVEELVVAELVGVAPDGVVVDGAPFDAAVVGVAPVGAEVVVLLAPGGGALGASGAGASVTVKNTALGCVTSSPVVASTISETTAYSPAGRAVDSAAVQPLALVALEVSATAGNAPLASVTCAWPAIVAWTPSTARTSAPSRVATDRRSAPPFAGRRETRTVAPTGEVVSGCRPSRPEKLTADVVDPASVTPTASAAFTRGPTLPRTSLVEMRRLRMADGVVACPDARRIAAAPATAGVAIDVPDEYS